MPRKKQKPKPRLQVWHIPQVPGKAFTVEVESIEDGVRMMRALAAYDDFQFKNHIKPDYANAQGLNVFDEDADDWVDWWDEETEIDDPEEYLEYIKAKEKQK